VAKGLTRAETREATSFAVGDTVRFTRDYGQGRGPGRGPARGRVIDPDRNRVALVTPDGAKIDWLPRQWGAGHVQAYAPRTMELREGDRIQFTRNDDAMGRTNGLLGIVTTSTPTNPGRLCNRQWPGTAA
jgi:hypothetical protein